MQLGNHNVQTKINYSMKQKTQPREAGSFVAPPQNQHVIHKESLPILKYTILEWQTGLSTGLKDLYVMVEAKKAFTE